METIVNRLPTNIQIEPTNFCNLNCKICNRKKYIKKPKHMGFLDFKRIIDNLGDINTLNIQGYGEPLLNKNIFDMIYYAKKTKNPYILFYTNGYLLSNKINGKIINSKVDEIRVSIDSPNPKIFCQIRGIPLKKIMRNITKLIQLKKKLGSNRPMLTFRATAMKDTFTEMPKLVQLAKEIGVDKVMVMGLGLEEGTEMATANQLLSNWNKKYIRNVIKKLQKEQEIEVLIDFTLLDLCKKIKLPKPLGFLIYKKGFHCSWPWNSCYIDVEGNIEPCCYFWYSKNTNTIKGNLKKENIRQIWNCESYQKLRLSLLKGKPLPVCQNCHIKTRIRKIAGYIKSPE